MRCVNLQGTVIQDLGDAYHYQVDPHQLVLLFLVFLTYYSFIDFIKALPFSVNT